MSYECFDVSVADGVARLTMNRPEKLNSMIPAFWRELPAIVAELDETAAARVIVLASAGRHFTAGMDLAVFAPKRPDEAVELGRRRAAMRAHVLALQETFSCLEKARMPVLAAIQGACIGGGMDMISACDMRYCTADAYFTIAEINIGLTADVGTLQRLPHLIPAGMMRELAFTGRKLPAARALEIGLVNQVFDSHAALLDGVAEIAREIAERSPLAVYGTKEMLTYARDHSVADGLDYIATWQAGMFHGGDTVEAIAAKQQNRTPAFGDLLRKEANAL